MRPTGSTAERIPSWRDAQRQQYLDVASKDLLAQGVVGVHDAAISVETMRFYRERHADLPLRIYGMLDCLNNTFCGGDLEPFSSDRFTLRSAFASRRMSE